MTKKNKKFVYTTVGYGVMSLLGEVYRMGRIEEFDTENETGYSSSEGSYCVPFDVAEKFENFINSLESDFPLSFSFGNMERCQKATSDYLNIPKDKLNDKETKKEYYKNKYPLNPNSIFNKNN